MTYLFAHNLVHAALQVALFFHALISNGDLFIVHLVISQFAMCTDIVNSILGLVPSKPMTTTIQIASRVAVVSLGNPRHFSKLALIWSMSDMTRYAYHVSTHMSMHKHSIYHNVLEWWRYSQYKILYPLGVTFEILSLLPNTQYKLFVIAIYAMYFPKMFNHTSKLETKRNILSLIGAMSESSPRDVKVVYNGSEYYFTYENAALIKERLSNARFQWKELEDENEYILKDYGLQVSWRLVYLVEYAGALVAYPYMAGASALYRLDVILWIIHYMKRIYESYAVHTFSSSTMPIENIFKNSLYYWGAGLIIGGLSDANLKRTPSWCVIGWVICQIGNLYTHAYLANLRKGRKQGEHVLPRNWLFRIVVSPNYGFEVLGWMFFAMIGIQANYFTLARCVFCLLGGCQMWVWAGGKKRRYKRLFGDKYKTKWRILPLL